MSKFKDMIIDVQEAVANSTVSALTFQQIADFYGISISDVLSIASVVSEAEYE